MYKKASFEERILRSAGPSDPTSGPRVTREEAAHGLFTALAALDTGIKKLPNSEERDKLLALQTDSVALQFAGCVAVPSPGEAKETRKKLDAIIKDMEQAKHFGPKDERIQNLVKAMKDASAWGLIWSEPFRAR